MPSLGLGRAVTLILLAACAVVGSYGAMAVSFQSGFFDTLLKAVGPDARKPYIPGSPWPFKTTYTGIAAIDAQLAILVAFFCSIIHGKQTWAVTLTWWYIMSHFCAGWTVLALEGLRSGNEKKMVRRTGLMGIIFQNISYTITVPVYLILHILTSPVAGSSTPELVLVDAEDLGALLLGVISVYIIPIILMSMPTLAVLYPTTHYNIIALWQAFPMWQSLYQWSLKKLLTLEGRPVRQSPRMYLRAVGTIYQFIITLCVSTQLGLLAVALTPASAVRPAFARMFSEVTLQSAFVPASLLGIDAIKATATHIPDVLAVHAQSFIQWDIYCGGTAILIWAIYLYSVSRRAVSVPRVIGKTLLWGLLGGPVAVATVLLWERDELVIESSEGKKKN